MSFLHTKETVYICALHPVKGFIMLYVNKTEMNTEFLSPRLYLISFLKGYKLTLLSQSQGSNFNL